MSKINNMEVVEHEISADGVWERLHINAQALELKLNELEYRIKLLEKGGVK